MRTQFGDFHGYEFALLLALACFEQLPRERVETIYAEDAARGRWVELAHSSAKDDPKTMHWTLNGQPLVKLDRKATMAEIDRVTQSAIDAIRSGARRVRVRVDYSGIFR